MTLAPGAEHTAAMAVIGGSTLELTLAQFWSSGGASSLAAELAFHGVGLEVGHGPGPRALAPWRCCSGPRGCPAPLAKRGGQASDRPCTSLRRAPLSRCAAPALRGQRPSAPSGSRGPSSTAA
jgi:hypothetical protein